MVPQQDDEELYCRLIQAEGEAARFAHLVHVAGRRIEFIFKPNPEGKIYHTRQVEYNGFIHSILSGTRYEQKGYRYFGERAYSDFIADTVAYADPQAQHPCA